MFVQPASGDDGTALGAALYLQRQRSPGAQNTRMGLPLWGPEFDRTVIEKAIASRPDCDAVYHDDFDALASEAARLMSEGKILANFQGRMEFGPRALGNRSILADPRPSDMRERINLLVKKREDFRPFAPAVIAEAATRYFVVDRNDDATYAYMLFVTHVRNEYREQLPAITHVDGSARLQTVDKAQNVRFWTLLSEFGKLSGIPVLLNTSFNVRGQPIVCNPKEAVDTFLDAGLDGLLIGNHLVLRKD
jgi:carbamoyltransferase